MDAIKVENLTKDYGHGRGIYNVTFSVPQGTTLGFLGPNGAGKSTTMRHLMGFSRWQSGSATILGYDCWQDYDKIKQHIGYLPGEVSLPAGLKGNEFIQMMQNLRKVKDDQRVKYLLEKFDLDPNQNVKKMSIGEKRKIAVVTAFMSDPEILLLDEPTSGLDPVMQEIFIDFIREEKARGKTILLSSHIFSEVEALCDNIAIIKDGKIVSIIKADDVKHNLRKTFKLTFDSKTTYQNFLKNEKFEIKEKFDKENAVAIIVEDPQMQKFMSVMTKYKLTQFDEITATLESYFMHFYKSDKKFGGIK